MRKLTGAGLVYIGVTSILILSLLCPRDSVSHIFLEKNLTNNPVGVFSIDQDALNRVGGWKHSVKLPEESGGGYMAYLEVFHLLHCVVRFSQERSDNQAG